MSLKVLDHDESRFNGDNSPRDEERPRINEFSLNHRSFARSNHLLDQTIATSLGRYQVSVFFFFWTQESLETEERHLEACSDALDSLKLGTWLRGSLWVT